MGKESGTIKWLCLRRVLQEMTIQVSTEAASAEIQPGLEFYSPAHTHGCWLETSASPHVTVFIGLLTTRQSDFPRGRGREGGQAQGIRSRF